MSDQQFTLTVGITVVVTVLEVDGELKEVVDVEVQTSGIVLSTTTPYAIVVQIEVVVTQTQLDITPFLSTAGLCKLTLCHVEVLVTAQQHIT